MDELDKFAKELDKFSDMLDDWKLTPEDYYRAFSEMCTKYNDTSAIPYDCFLLGTL